MADTRSAAREARELIDRCLTGTPDAIDEFQRQYGALIYSYPMRVYRMPPEDAGDFYVFTFEKGRIFRRTQTYEGRTSLRSYISGFVLDNLVLEWKRGAREVETVSIETLSELHQFQHLARRDQDHSGSKRFRQIDDPQADSRPDPAR